MRIGTYNICQHDSLNVSVELYCGPRAKGPTFSIKSVIFLNFPKQFC